MLNHPLSVRTIFFVAKFAHLFRYNEQALVSLDFWPDRNFWRKTAARIVEECLRAA